ncbi:zinc finger BED domain-containing protein RICESLEEPER 2-like [Senna tora]|uniref:Zinc finger BED domain-containing protein RICESLEEPER 2-like n=1 Tax=Senna tora TaxID=362788 RepID=A0A834VYT2_9FABA|nr:zinc finger BED domain-containing protein RICESLEEPER 2-like [Senna tora]
MLDEEVHAVVSVEDEVEVDEIPSLIVDRGSVSKAITKVEDNRKSATGNSSRAVMNSTAISPTDQILPCVPSAMSLNPPCDTACASSQQSTNESLSPNFESARPLVSLGRSDEDQYKSTSSSSTPPLHATTPHKNDSTPPPPLQAPVTMLLRFCLFDSASSTLSSTISIDSTSVFPFSPTTITKVQLWLRKKEKLRQLHRAPKLEVHQHLLLHQLIVLVKRNNNQMNKHKRQRKTYACGSKSHGTSNLSRHLTVECPQNPDRQVNKKQKTVTYEKKPEEDGDPVGRLKIDTFDQYECRMALAQMIILDEFPFRFVENEGFRLYSNKLQQKFVVLSRSTVARDHFDLFLMEKGKLKSMLSNDSWTLNKKILGFFLIADHKGETIGKALEKCLKDWGIAKICTITVNNASSNNVAISYLVRRLSDWNCITILNGDFMHLRCCAHILNLIVNDGLKEIDSSIARIRAACRFVKSSPARMYGSIQCASMLDKLRGILKKLFEYYQVLYPLPVDTGDSSCLSTDITSEGGGDDDDDDGSWSSEFYSQVKKKQNDDKKNELERYLDDNVEFNYDGFDILKWWKSKTVKYPILSRNARDVLAIPISTVSSESAFSTGGRVLDPFRSSLNPTTVESFICAQNWLRTPKKEIYLRSSMDEIESTEAVLKFTGTALVFTFVKEGSFSKSEGSPMKDPSPYRQVVGSL